MTVNIVWEDPKDGINCTVGVLRKMSSRYAFHYYQKR